MGHSDETHERDGQTRGRADEKGREDGKDGQTRRDTSGWVDKGAVRLDKRQQRLT